MPTNLSFSKITSSDYFILTEIMTAAFNEDTALHTNIKEDGPTGYNDGSLIKKLNEHISHNST